MRRAQRKEAHSFKYRWGFNDTQLAEFVDRTDPPQVAAHLESVFGYCDMAAVPCTFSGVVLTDSYGNGAFQK